MALKVKGLNAVIGTLSKLERRGSNALDDGLNEAGDLLVKTVKDYAPFDTGATEANVESKVVQAGVFQRLEVTIGGEAGEYLQHSELTNAERNRGPGTVAKGPDAGPLFLRRAVRDTSVSIGRILKRALQRGLSK